MKEKFDVTGMTCAACQANVEKAVCKVPGVQEVSVSLLTNSMQVEFEDSVSPEAMPDTKHSLPAAAPPRSKKARLPILLERKFAT